MSMFPQIFVVGLPEGDNVWTKCNKYTLIFLFLVTYPVYIHLRNITLYPVR